MSRHSGLDFSDGMHEPAAVDGVPNGGANLHRNKTERSRIQPLQRSSNGPSKVPVGATGFVAKYNLWMINEGPRQIFLGVFVLLHVVAAVLATFHYSQKDNLTQARATYGVTFTIARSAAVLLHIDVIFILLPVCRNFISLVRRTPLGDVIPFDKNITFHKAVAWSIVAGSVVHTGAHIFNLVWLTQADKDLKTVGSKVVFFITANFIIGPLITGWLMWICLGVMVWFAMEKRRRANFEKFWYTHHLFIAFFILWQLHGMFCMIQPDRPPYCSFNTIGVFWRYWIVGGIIWIFERVLREVRSRHRTYISKVIQHPSDVMELQIKKDHTTTRAGQYIFINCPEVSHFQWHPFTLTSSPEEDYISVHIRVAGDWTTAMSKAVGCEFKKKKGEKGGDDAGGKVVGTSAKPPLNRTLPRVMVDGPFGTASEDFLNFETVLLVGAGIGVTPFASILKSIWYRMNNFNNSKPTRLSKVYFTWVIRDFASAEWFRSLLAAIEENDTQNRIEINIYTTTKVKPDEMNNIFVQDVGAEKDAITNLRAPTHYGRPNWDRVFSSIGDKHPESDVGVFFCGPPVLSKQLHIMSNKYSDPAGTRFFFSKENF